MSTLKKVDIDTLNKQIENSKGQLISKEKVLTILHDKLREVDAKNKWIVDQFDGVFVKELINSINGIEVVKNDDDLT
jgi:hypothetical protein